jgi:hypothetical protein
MIYLAILIAVLLILAVNDDDNPHGDSSLYGN